MNSYDALKYPTFASSNRGVGTLKVQVFVANHAYPLEGVKVVITKEIEKETVLFYEGYTNSSGIIDPITLPSIKQEKEVESVEDILYTTYTLKATHPTTFEVRTFEVSIFDNMKIIQPINFSFGGTI